MKIKLKTKKEVPELKIKKEIVEDEKPNKKLPKWCHIYRDAVLDSKIIDVKINENNGDLELFLSNGNILELHDFIINRIGFKLGSTGITNCIYFSKYEQHKYCGEIEKGKEEEYYNFRYKK